MKITFKRFALFFLLVISLCITPSVGAQTSTQESGFVSQQIIISLKSGPISSEDMVILTPNNLGTDSLNQIAMRYDILDIQPVFYEVSRSDSLAIEYGLPNIYVLSVGPDVNLWAMLNDFQSSPDIEYAEFNKTVTASVIPNDPTFSSQWSLNNAKDHDIDAPEAWNIQKGRSEVMIAIIDTGILYSHPDFVGGRVRTDIMKDFINNDNDAKDDNGHGTHVAGIIAANTNNGKGIAGICWYCQILPIKVLNAQGNGDAATVAKGIQYAADKGAKIINMSLGLDPNCGCSKTIAKAINYAYGKGSLLIAASGNNGKSKISYPASSSRVMAIGATDINDKKTSWSNYGVGLDLVAPGNNISSTWLGNGYASKSGTSMAAPHAAGVAGLIWSKNLHLKNSQVWWALQHSTDDLGTPGWDNTTGFGRLNAYKAVRLNITGKVNALTDGCTTEPESGCGGCSTAVALSGVSTAEEDLKTLYSFRNDVLSQTERGKQWTDLFYRHTYEVSGILKSNSELLLRATAVLTDSMPGIRLLVANGKGKPVILTKALLDEITQFKDALVQQGSPSLAADLEQVWLEISPEKYIGQNVVEIWAAITR